MKLLCHQLLSNVFRTLLEHSFENRNYPFIQHSEMFLENIQKYFKNVLVNVVCDRV